MNVTIAEPAEIVLRNASDDRRRRVGAWIDMLKKWDTDLLVRQHSKKLDVSGNVYMLITNADARIFFELGEDTITVLDLANEATIASFGRVSGVRSPSS